MKVINKDTGLDYELDLRKIQGEEHLVCPACVNDRKKKTQKCLSWYHDQRHGKCHHCGVVFVIFKPKIEKEYTRPEWVNNTTLSDDAVKFFEARGITQFTLRQCKVTTGTDWMPEPFNKEVETIHFNYFRDGKLVNIKYRAKGKIFKIYKDAELIFYNLDFIKDTDDCYIVEGEMDALSLWECGFHNAISVPNGAKNFSFLDNCYDQLESKKKVIIAVDNDEPGIILRNELIRRIGTERCFIVDFESSKDANAYLMTFGKEKLIEKLNSAKEIPIDGVVFLAQVWDKMLDTFKNGKVFGTTTYLKKLDPHWKHRPGEVTIWTGYNNEGKSTLLSQIEVLKAEKEGFRTAIFSPESYPVDEFYDELIHIHTGKSTDKRYTNVLSENEYFESSKFIHEHFFAVIPEENYQLDNILSKFRRLIRKYGVNSVVIDPYNQIEHLMERGDREDLYISRFMTILKRFAVDNWVEVHLVAHQVTPMFSGKENYPQPDTYKIKGGGTFSDKADNVIAVWRPFRKSDYENTLVRVIIGKIKKQKLVGIPGEIDLYFDRAKNQYRETEKEEIQETLIDEIPSNNDFNINKTTESNKDDLPF